MISTKVGIGANLTESPFVDAVVGRVSIPASNGILLKKHRDKGSLFIVFDDFESMFYEKGHIEYTLEKLHWMQRFGLSPAQSILLLDGSKNEIRVEQRDLALEWNLNGGTTLYKIGNDIKLNLEQIEKKLNTIDFVPDLQTSLIAMLPAIDIKMAKQYASGFGFALFLQALTNPTTGLKNHWNIDDSDVRYMREILGIGEDHDTIDFSLFKKKENNNGQS